VNALRSITAGLLLAYIAAFALALVILAAVGQLSGAAVAAAGITAGTSAALVGAIALAVRRQMRNLAGRVRAIAARDFSSRNHPPDIPELRELSLALHEMERELNDAFAALSSDRDRLSAALAAGSEAVLALDASNRVLFASPAAQRLFGRDVAGLEGRPLAWVLPDVEVAEALEAARRSGPHTIVLTRPGDRHIQIVASSLPGDGDWSALLVCSDVTEVRRTERVRRDFLANVSHELRTPLAALKSVIETLSAGALQDEESARGFLKAADSEVDRLVQMVEEILELSRIESGEIPMARQRVNVPEVLESAVRRLSPAAERAGLHLVLHGGDSIPHVPGDTARLERAVLNLIANAIKFTPAGGVVTVSATPAEGSVRIEVADTGPGIDPADLPRIFERFYRGDRARGSGGTGLGLAIVKHIAQAHGGTVSAQNRSDHGAVFTITLPLQQPDSVS
jgi:two-component system, OmpR family, phosphate regulon sensor histidine kinase PhoR